MIKKWLSRLLSRQSRDQIIEDPRFHKDEIGTKLITNFQPRINLGEKRFNERETLERDMAKEREKIQRERIKEEEEKKWEEVKIENSEQA